MDRQIDSQKTLEIIERMKLAKIGDYKKWKAIIKKIGGVAKYLRDLQLEQVLELLSHVNTFIGNDSGITHLAAGLGVRTLALFSPTNPAVYKPMGPDIRIFNDNTAIFAKEPSASLQNELLDVLTRE